MAVTRGERFRWEPALQGESDQTRSCTLALLALAGKCIETPPCLNSPRGMPPLPLTTPSTSPRWTPTKTSGSHSQSTYGVRLTLAEAGACPLAAHILPSLSCVRFVNTYKFCARLQLLFAAMDGDRDGLVSEAELQAYMASHPAVRAGVDEILGDYKVQLADWAFHYCQAACTPTLVPTVRQQVWTAEDGFALDLMGALDKGVDSKWNFCVSTTATPTGNRQGDRLLSFFEFAMTFNRQACCACGSSHVV